MDLKTLGWIEASQNENFDPSSLARITAIHRSHLRAVAIDGEINLYYSGSQQERPAVGDWVSTTPQFIDEQNEPGALIKEIIPRRSKISRFETSNGDREQILAANIDNVFIVSSINQDFNINRLERYILLVQEGKARPIVLISKVDLSKDIHQTIKDLESKLSKEVLVIPTSSLNKVGLGKLKELMPSGSTSVFIGSSGVGKSSLVNRLIGEDIQVVKEVRENDDKGRHATTSRQMFFIPGGGMIIDTPGIREVTVFGSESSLAATFAEIDSIINQCKFSNCTHTSEKGCAIHLALESEELSEKQWANYQKLQKEMAFNNQKVNASDSANSKKRWKKIQTNYKARKKFEGRD